MSPDIVNAILLLSYIILSVAIVLSIFISIEMAIMPESVITILYLRTVYDVVNSVVNLETSREQRYHSVIVRHDVN